MHDSIRREIEQRVGVAVATASSVPGGDINEAFRLGLADGRVVFVKVNAGADPRMFPTEAEGLRRLGEGPLRVPSVLASEPRYLMLEWIERGRPSPRSGEQLGRGLARLHRLGCPSFGASPSSFLGTIAMDDTTAPDWASFYGARRLEPLLRAAAARGCASPAMRRGVERVLSDLPRLVGPSEPPARLHGDLWSGNVLHDTSGAPVLLDPAAYGGHREVDLAMMRLFGGFGPEVFAAYAEEHPLAPGHAARVPLYQLLPLLAHVVLFGGGYVGSVEEALGAIR